VRFFSSVPLIAEPLRRKSQTFRPSSGPRRSKLLAEPTNPQPTHIYNKNETPRLQQVLEMPSVVPHAFLAPPCVAYTHKNEHLAGLRSCNSYTTAVLYGFSFKGFVTIRADGFETSIFCANRLREFRGMCSGLDRVLSNYSSMRTRPFSSAFLLYRNEPVSRNPITILWIVLSKTVTSWFTPESSSYFFRNITLRIGVAKHSLLQCVSRTCRLDTGNSTTEWLTVYHTGQVKATWVLESTTRKPVTHNKLASRQLFRTSLERSEKNLTLYVCEHFTSRVLGFHLKIRHSHVTLLKHIKHILILRREQ
jgi:hypothetical protein